jgi:translation elongation factor EF-4
VCLALTSPTDACAVPREGKKRLRAVSFGRVQIPQEAFLSVLNSRPNEGK